MSEQTRHPQHDQVAQAVRDWFRQPFEGMGYRSEVGPFGTYWSTGMVYPSRVAAVYPDAFVTALRARYKPGEVVVNLDDDFLQERLATALMVAGWREGESDMFLAHTSTAPVARSRPGIVLEPASEANLREFSLAGLISFDDVESSPDEPTLAAEMARRREELAGSGRGLLARYEGVPAGIMRCFADPLDIWIRGLAVRPAFRGRGIGSALVERGLIDGYTAGRRSLLINVALANSGAQRLYQRLGFGDEVYRRRQFEEDIDADSQDPQDKKKYGEPL